MGTAWAEIVTDYAMVEINDIRLQKDAQENPALFFRRMSLYMKNAVPLFNQPPEMQSWLSGTEPSFGDTTWTSPGGEDSQTVETGLVGFQLMSVAQEEIARTGELLLLPYTGAAYDPDTGAVTFPGGISEGTRFRLDFYTDGTFDNTLSQEEKRILGKCVALVWNEHFAADWLNLQPKIQDKSFSVGSEANHIRSLTERGRVLRSALYEEMRRYAQNLAYQDLAKRGALRPYRRG